MDTKSVQPEPPELLTCEEAAAELGITNEKTIKNWLRGGHFPGSLFTNREWYFNKAKVMEVKEQIKKIREKRARGDLAVDWDAFDDPDDEKTLNPFELADLCGMCGHAKRAHDGDPSYPRRASTPEEHCDCLLDRRLQLYCDCKRFCPYERVR